MAKKTDNIKLRIIESPEDMVEVEKLERQIWLGDTPVPYHMHLAIVHNGGVVIGAYDGDRLLGYVFGFVGSYESDDGLRFKHCSHQLGIHPDFQDQGIGNRLKRAQWQLVRQQGLDLITWTYDPLETRNAYLNLAKLGAVCNTYLQNEYGDMIDELNAGIPSDRFMVHWWINSQRVTKRLSRESRKKLDLAHFLAADVEVINTTTINDAGWPVPAKDRMDLIEDPESPVAMTLFEVPADFQGIKAADVELAKEWRLYSRTIFELFFHQGFLVTDMVFLPGKTPRCYYVLSQGENTLGD
jgi:predicted GNAT superfamily acetyltransferase